MVPFGNIVGPAPSAERRVIRDGNGDTEHLSDRTEQTFGLSERLVEHQAECETGLDGDRGIDRLTGTMTSPPLANRMARARREARSHHNRRYVRAPTRHRIQPREKHDRPRRGRHHRAPGWRAGPSWVASRDDLSNELSLTP